MRNTVSQSHYVVTLNSPGVLVAEIKGTTCDVMKSASGMGRESFMRRKTRGNNGHAIGNTEMQRKCSRKCQTDKYKGSGS
jgi:hypothetical protein